MTLDEWTAAAAAELGIDALDNREQRVVLDVAREAAHNILRPAAPLTTFLLGYAVARGATLADAAETLTGLARRLAEPAEPADDTPPRRPGDGDRRP